MEIKKVYAVYFSPTRGTKKYIEGIAGRISPDFEAIDLTKPKLREKVYIFKNTDLVIFGVPVYAGRVPSVPDGIFSRIYGNSTPAVFNVCYGNRDFDDALLEEKDLCEENGFKGIAAASWIAPHTFSDKVAAGRPDGNDEAKMSEFAKKVKALLKKDLDSIKELSIRGNRPYKEAVPMPYHPSGNESCTRCGNCISVCPTSAVDINDPRKTDNDRCINCLACVKNCPSHSRNIYNPMFGIIIKGIEEKLTADRKEPEFFL